MIVVQAGQATGLHYHNLRDDMWVILDDGLEVQVGDEVHHPAAGDEFIVRAGTPHRLRAGDVPGRVLEIDFGYTMEEDDFHLEEGGDHPGSGAGSTVEES